MELRHLRHFAILADELHFGRAAARLGLTQPPLSVSLGRLEDELGVRLLERGKAGVSLTAAGALFLDETQKILERTAQTREITKRAQLGRGAWLRIGFSESGAYAGLPQLVTSYCRQYPQIEVGLVEAERSKQFAALLDGRIHAAFVETNAIPPGFANALVCDDGAICALPSRHALAHKPVIELGDLTDEDFVLFSRKGDSANADRVTAMCANEGFEPRVVNYAEQWMSVLALVAAGLGVTILPRRVASARMQGVRFVPLAAAAWPPSRVHLIWEKGRVSPEVQAFADLAVGHGAPNVARPDERPRSKRHGHRNPSPAIAASAFSPL